MNHLTEVERYHIYIRRKEGMSISEIARELERSKSTISDELRRNTGDRGYRHQQAQRFAEERWEASHGGARKLHGATLELIEEYLRMDWSPEQVSGYLNVKHDISIHHESIYQYVYADKEHGGDLHEHLRRANRVYKKRYGGKDNRGKIKNRRPLEERPAEAESREVVGHWEGDTVKDKDNNRSIVTLVERVSRFTVLTEVESLHADAVAEAIVEAMKPHQGQVKSITFDNGKEFAAHEKIAEQLNADIYFAAPYHSWERGTNENTNGLLRQYFPKRKVRFQREMLNLVEVERILNSRPRKTLGFYTPIEVLSKHANIEVTYH